MPGLVPDATGTPAGGGGMDPLGMINQLTEFQLRMNQNKQFQAQFMANQAIGEAVAHSGSLEEGLDNLQKSPMAPLMFGFGGQALSDLRTARMLQLQGANITQEMQQRGQQMSNSGYESAVQTLLQAAQDPLNYKKYAADGMARVDPSVRARVQPAMDHITDAIGQKLSQYDLSDPQQLQAAKSAVAALAGGAYAAAGGDPSHLTPFLGGITETTMGGPVKTPGILQQGSQGPAGIISTGTGGGGGSISQAQPTSYTAPTGDKLTVNPGPIASQYMERDRNGNIAYQNGIPVLNPNLQEHNQELLKEYGSSEKEKFNQAQNVESTLGQMNAAVDDIVAHGDKFAQPGAFGSVRVELLKGMQAIQDFTGQEFTGKAKLANEYANVQEIEKWHQALMFQFKQMMDSGQRGLGVLMEAGAAVPGMENTPLGFKLLSAGLKAQADWEIGKYNFKNQWLTNPASGGTLIGADADYARQLSPSDVARKAVGNLGFQMGMNTDTGQWKNKAALESAYTGGAFGKVGSPEAKEVVKSYIRKGFSEPTPPAQ